LPVGILFKIFKRSKVVFDAHEDYIDFMKQKDYIPKSVRGLLSAFMIALLYISGKALDAFIFSDEGTALEMKFLPSRKKIFFYNFPVLAFFPDQMKTWKDRCFDVVFVGTMSRTSGTLVMLNAIAELAKTNPKLKCLFIGEPEHAITKEVHQIISENGLSNMVTFTGRLPHGSIPELLQDCKIGLIGLLDLPKFQKNISTKLFEYLASGIPMVSSDLPPERNFLEDGKHCIFIKPGESHEMSKAIIKIKDGFMVLYD
jgi:glycosyltransferase involved in cell wall biosynthesis